MIEYKSNYETLDCSIERILSREKQWRLTLPDDYKTFLLTKGGSVPVKKSFKLQNHTYAINRFLAIFDNAKENHMGWYDISVVLSQIEDRLTDDEDLVGADVLPIAELFAGDYLCLDFRQNKEAPVVCVWSHEESGELDPVLYKVANSFTEFEALLF